MCDRKCSLIWLLLAGLLAPIRFCTNHRTNKLFCQLGQRNKQDDTASIILEAHCPCSEADPCGVMVLGAKGRESNLEALANAVLWLLLVAKRFYKIGDARVVSLLGISGPPWSDIILGLIPTLS